MGGYTLWNTSGIKFESNSFYHLFDWFFFKFRVRILQIMPMELLFIKNIKILATYSYIYKKLTRNSYLYKKLLSLQNKCHLLMSKDVS